MRIRPHRHRFEAKGIRGLWQRVVCKTKGCSFVYEQGLLFDPRRI